LTLFDKLFPPAFAITVACGLGELEQRIAADFQLKGVWKRLGG
jgi:hypothetical protein